MDNFLTIKAAYDSFYKYLLSNGKFAIKDTKIGFWGPSVAEEIYALFKSINLENYENFIDLGSGDGKVVLIASLFTKAHGIEFDPWLFNASQVIKNKITNIPEIKRATISNGDFMKHDISSYSMVFCAPDKPMHRGLEIKLLKELTGTYVHYGHHFKPQVLNRKLAFHISGTHIALYSNNITGQL